jgi:hypothetical protein
VPRRLEVGASHQAELATVRGFPRDRHQLHLWEIGQAAWSKKVGWDDAEELERKLQAQLGSPAKLEVLPLLYRPEVAHEELPENDEEYEVHRIRVGSVVV